MVFLKTRLNFIKYEKSNYFSVVATSFGFECTTFHDPPTTNLIQDRPHNAIMDLHQVDLPPFPDLDDSTTYSGTTPPESVATDVPDHDDCGSAKPNSLVPWPGSTYIIRSVSSGHLMTLLDGQVLLTQAGGRGSIHWRCVETKGWLGFQNTVSGKFLGHDKNRKLSCFAGRHREWEYFCSRPRPEGDCVLLMQHWDSLWQVGIQEEQGEEKLAKIEDGDGVGWEFLEV